MIPVMLLMALAVLTTELVAMRVVHGTWKRRMGLPKNLGEASQAI